MKLVPAVLAAAVLAVVASSANATVYTFEAVLDGLQETPPNASPGTGFSTLTLDDVLHQITVDASFSGLTAPAQAAHIHNAPPGTAGSIIFPLSGVPAATAGNIPSQSFGTTAAQEAEFFAGNMYINIHSSTFPGGEIRGQYTLAVPEPASLSLLAFATLPLLARRPRRTR